jgi:hypothetical protein
MADSIPLPSQVQARSSSYAGALTQSVPWYIWSCLIAVICSVVGGAWDISWHESVGRDTFWTAPHLLIQLCGILSGLSCGYLILSITFHQDSPLRDRSISMWGFRGPMGAFICAWGGVAMITSAPFDNWWHEAYGLDVKILSPPHVLLALGMIAIRFGTLVMILSEFNRAQDGYRAKLERLVFLGFIFLMGMTLGIAQEYTGRESMHSANFYLVVMLIVPIWIAAAVRASSHRWAATIVALLYTSMHLAFTWFLPLVPAEPKLGPVYQKITHLVPMDFPLLLIVPAIALDLVRHRTFAWNKWTQAVVLAATFLATFLAVQWPFANFLLSPASHNWIFTTGPGNLPYFVPPGSSWVSNVFVNPEGSVAAFCSHMVMPLAVGVLMMRIGLGWGDWMRRIRR